MRLRPTWFATAADCFAAASTLRVAASLLSAVAALAACSNEPQDSEPCPRRGPTFRVQVTASQGYLPLDTHVSVSYGGSSLEQFGLRRGNGDNQDVCCRAMPSPSEELGRVACGALDGGTAHGPPRAIECELNTNGAAVLTVRATGYQELEQTLVADRSEAKEWEHCDVLITRDVFAELTRGDAGVPGF